MTYIYTDTHTRIHKHVNDMNETVKFAFMQVRACNLNSRNDQNFLTVKQKQSKMKMEEYEVRAWYNLMKIIQ